MNGLALSDGRSRSLRWERLQNEESTRMVDFIVKQWLRMWQGTIVVAAKTQNSCSVFFATLCHINTAHRTSFLKSPDRATWRIPWRA